MLGTNNASMDFNINNPHEGNYRPVALVIDPLSIFKNELLMMFESEPTDVLGYYKGLSMGDMVFKTSEPEHVIQSRVMDMISQECVYASEFIYDVNVFFLDNGDRSYTGVIQVDIASHRDPSKIIGDLEFLYKL